jgi:hypothetical protein
MNPASSFPTAAAPTHASDPGLGSGTLVQLVPRLPPAIDGLGDYAAGLAARLAARHGLASRFLVGDPAWQASEGSPAGARPLPRRTADELVAAIAADGGSSTVMLHFVNYAYQSRGCPWWLVEGLTRWRRAAPQRRLVVMFHETYAFGPPWRSAFWLSPLQRLIARRLHALADVPLTNVERYARWLWRGRLPPSAPRRIWPVLSNVGEPAEVAPAAAREPALVVFGRPSNRAMIYRENGRQLRELMRSLGLTVLHDIGPRLDEAPPELPGVRFHGHGPLPVAEVSALLGRSAVGFVNNADGPLAKSGVFAAYCSHGLAIVACKPYPDEDGLRCGTHYLVAGTAADAAGRAAASAAARAWYQEHASAALADGIAALLGRTGARAGDGAAS